MEQRFGDFGNFIAWKKSCSTRRNGIFVKSNQQKVRIIEALEQNLTEIKGQYLHNYELAFFQL